jgi:hypothetical protein
MTWLISIIANGRNICLTSFWCFALALNKCCRHRIHAKIENRICNLSQRLVTADFEGLSQKHTCVSNRFLVRRRWQWHARGIAPYVPQPTDMFPVGIPSKCNFVPFLMQNAKCKSRAMLDHKKDTLKRWRSRSGRYLSGAEVRRCV